MERNLKDQQFIQFLQEELDLSAADIAMALRHRQGDHEPLPMLLWQYGLVSLQQLSQIFDWREKQVQWNFGHGSQATALHRAATPMINYLNELMSI